VTGRRFLGLSIGGLLVMRILMVSNGLLLLGIGSLYLAFGARPSGYVVGGVLVALAMTLWMLIPLTDPYRSERGR
jgi:hypothetical protein